MIHCHKSQAPVSAPDKEVLQPSIQAIDQLNYTIASDLRNISPIWDVLPGTIFMSSEYLTCLQSAPAAGMEFKYVVIHAGQTPIAKLYFQIVHFNAARSLGQEASIEADKCSYFSHLMKSIKLTVARNIDFHTIVCGNLLLTGENGWVFADHLSQKVREEIIEVAYAQVRDELKKTHKDEIAVSLLKEKYAEAKLSAGFITAGKWHEFRIQPNMLLNLEVEWRSFEDYLNSMHSKYRMRAKRAQKKLGSIVVESLSEAEIKENSAVLYKLYLETIGSAGFNMVNLGMDYFYETKKNMPDCFHVKVFRKDSEIVGFFSYFINNEVLVAHMVGFNSLLNKTHQIYLNMLYQLVQEGIERSLERINLGRTAMEIKSSVGAYPVDMYCYIRHRNRIYNKFAPNLIDLLSPQEDWLQRHPFKIEERAEV
jgi:hypothetical protein